MPRPILKLKHPSKRFAKPQRRPTETECLCRLISYFPDLFNPFDPLPLAIGIHAEMRANTAMSGVQIRRALRLWTSTREYQAALARGGPRYGIDGSVDGEVTDEAIARASEWLGSLDASEDGG